LDYGNLDAFDKADDEYLIEYDNDRKVISCRCGLADILAYNETKLV